MRTLLLTVLLTILTLTTSAEEITTGNLVTNGNFETGNSNGWTTSGDVQVLSDCCELNNVTSNYDLEFGNSGSIQQDFNLSTDTITQDMLNNGIVLDSTIDAQNGECGVAGCWGGQGQADTFTNVLTIKDSDGNTLASNTTIRTDVTGIDGAIFTDRLIYNGLGSNVGNINISGSDANAPGYLGGPNVDNISVTMTYDTTVIATEIIEEIEDIFENIEEIIEEEFTFEQIEELFEEMVTFFKEPPAMEEEFEEMTFEPMLMVLEEMPMEEEFSMEEEMIIEEMPMEEEVSTSFFTMLPPPEEEEIYEETKEIIASFLPMVSEEEETFAEEELTTSRPVLMEPTEEESKEEEVVEEEPTKMVLSPSREEPTTKEEEIIEEESTEVIEESNEETKEEIKEEKPSGKTPRKSTVQTKKLAKQKTIQQKKTIKDNLVKVMDKIDKDIKDISKNLQIKNIIKLDAMASDQASLAVYESVEFYKPKNLYLDQLNIFDSRQLYPDTSLTSYIQDDPVFIKQQQLRNLDNIKQQLLYELEILKNG